jgi:hypothetical protein
VFGFGETEKNIAITPRADDNAFTGNTPFVLHIKSAPNAKIEDGEINVTITEAGGFAGFQTFLANTIDGDWEINYYDYSLKNYSYTAIAFAATVVDSIYNLGIGSHPSFKVSFSKQDYSMTVEIPQYAGMDASSYFLRWSGSIIRENGLYPSEAPAKFVLPFNRVNFGTAEQPHVVQGYVFPSAFILGLWAYTEPHYIESNVVPNPGFLIDDIIIDFYQ